MSSIKKLDYSLIKTELIHFILPALIATVPMAIISYFPPRAFLAYEVMFMIIFSKNITVIAEHFKQYNIIIAIISILCGLLVFGHFSPSTLAQINYLIPYKEKVTAQYEDALNKSEKDVLVSKFEYLNWIHAEDYINISNFFPELNYHMPVNALICQYYGFDRVTAVGDNEYLVEVKVNTEGIHNYAIYEKETWTPIQFMEYDDTIRYCIPKDKLGSYVLYSEEDILENKVLDYKVRYIGGELVDININDLIFKK